jgi:uncharacterized protein YigA (DUF484 family)
MRDMLLQKILNAPVFTAFDKVHPIEQTRSWLRRLLERIRRPSKRAQRLDTHEKLLSQMARQNYELAQKFQELQRRLAHHERGPLQASAERLNGARKSGLILPGQRS